MINAKQEFIEHIKQHCLGGRTVRCAKIQFEYNYDDDDKPIMHVLPVGYTPEDLVLFLAEIDRNYNNGWGGQELYGTIWYTDGKTWSERGSMMVLNGGSSAKYRRLHQNLWVMRIVRFNLW